MIISVVITLIINFTFESFNCLVQRLFTRIIQWISVLLIVEGALCPDYVYLYVCIQPKLSVLVAIYGTPEGERCTDNKR